MQRNKESKPPQVLAGLEGNRDEHMLEWTLELLKVLELAGKDNYGIATIPKIIRQYRARLGESIDQRLVQKILYHFVKEGVVKRIVTGMEDSSWNYELTDLGKQVLRLRTFSYLENVE